MRAQYIDRSATMPVAATIEVLKSLPASSGIALAYRVSRFCAGTVYGLAITWPVDVRKVTLTVVGAGSGLKIRKKLSNSSAPREPSAKYQVVERSLVAETPVLPSRF